MQSVDQTRLPITCSPIIADKESRAENIDVHLDEKHLASCHLHLQKKKVASASVKMNNQLSASSVSTGSGPGPSSADPSSPNMTNNDNIATNATTTNDAATAATATTTAALEETLHHLEEGLAQVSASLERLRRQRQSLDTLIRLQRLCQLQARHDRRKMTMDRCGLVYRACAAMAEELRRTVVAQGTATTTNNTDVAAGAAGAGNITDDAGSTNEGSDGGPTTTSPFQGGNGEL
ncbi:hypothetical protein BD289DRAFT_139220 [Coniella lustricola]|uniref:Uncharacterized protein n=1 Tax=Coniella lustricola TaxID=2025994 RepID=A0A2T2ZVE7_9PEZI|nr:hypothetical protein BD289DRAFT_139220 [Coniella lustricola]